MTDVSQPEPRTGVRPITCQRCGTEFDWPRDGPGGCWCAAESYRLPVPSPAKAVAFSECLCPWCLRAAAELLAARHP